MEVQWVAEYEAIRWRQAKRAQFSAEPPAVAPFGAPGVGLPPEGPIGLLPADLFCLLVPTDNDEEPLWRSKLIEAEGFVVSTAGYEHFFGVGFFGRDFL